MRQGSKRIFLIICLFLSFVLSYKVPAFRSVFGSYQIFLLGVGVGALLASTIGLIIERDQWNHYRTYFFTVMISAFVLVMINCIVFKILGGEQFFRKLVGYFMAVFSSG